MKYLQNLHTHSTFCDGKDTPEQMVISAYQQGFNSIGFSGHSYMYYAPKNSMSETGSLEYIEEIKRLKQKYSFCEAQDASFLEYGYGATMVKIR